MTERTNPPGTFCWVELATSDAVAATEFYSAFFGWSAHETPMGEGAPCVHFKLEGEVVAAMYQVDPDQPNARPDVWGAYVAVDDVDAAAAWAAELGGSIVVPPFDVMTEGRMAVLLDPQGATLNLWQAGDSCGVTAKGVAGSLCWSELLTTEPEAAARFYGDLFGWRPVTMDMPAGPYTSFCRGDSPECGMLKLQEEWGEVPPHWVVYFAVGNCDEAVALSAELGAETLVDATDVPDVGRFAWLRDPTGSVFAIIQLSGE